MVTDRDIAVRVVAAGRDPSAATAADAMSTPCRTVDSETSLRDGTRLMETEQVRRVPVTDREGRLAGIVSIADIALAGRTRLPHRWSRKSASRTGNKRRSGAVRDH